MASKQKTKATEVMVVNESPGEECRIAILEDNHLEELYTERVATATNVSNIYKGRVINVEPAIQAAFVDYGQGVNGFLHISDLHPRYFPGGERVERVGRKIPRRHRPPIQEALKRGDEVLVQVLKEGIGTKGPTLTSYLSIPGRLIVAMPDMDRVGVSRKVEDEDRRREMRRILDSVDLPAGFGFILRTAGFGRTKTDLKRDVAYLMRLWKVIDKRIKNVGAPCELYTESDLLIRTIRDVLRPAIEAVVVDTESAYERVKGFLHVVAPRSAPKVIRYRRSTPLFHAFDIERQIELIHSREVPLPSGGRLIIDQTEALVAIDVNSGKSRGARDSETNAYQTNCEAVDEICRQLRLRDLGGLIVNDLIDMRQHKHRRLIEERFRENLKRDRARSTILRISDFGLMEMTRQRMRPSLHKSHFITCPHCLGHGEIKSPGSVAADVTRQAEFLLDHERVRRVEVVCSPRVASVLLSRKRRDLVQLEEASGKTIDVRVSDDIAVDRVDYYAYDERNADINVEQLPTPLLPSLAELEKEQTAVASDEREPVEKPRGHKRSRRRRGGPADATAIALAGPSAGGPEKQAEEAAAEPAKKKPRHRRRRKKSVMAPEPGKAAGTEAQAAADEGGDRVKAPSPGKRRKKSAGPAVRRKEGPAKSAMKTLRVHELAKQFGVPSRRVLERCREHGGIDVKNHMSSVTVEAARMIRGWFADVGADRRSEGESSAVETPDRVSRRHRRGKRGGRRKTSHTARAAGEGPAKRTGGEAGASKIGEAKEPVSTPTSAADDSIKKKRRRVRRERRPRRTGDDRDKPASPDAAASGKGQTAGAAGATDRNVPDREGKTAGQARPASRRRKKKLVKKNKPASGDGKDAERSSEAAARVETGEEEAKEPRKKPRTLYRSRRKIARVSTTDADDEAMIEE